MPIIPERKEAAALALYDAGYWIVLCRGDAGKKPISTNWPTVRVSRESIASDLRDDPRLNIAIVLNQSPYCDVECDTPESVKQLAEWCGGEPPVTPAWSSERGNHYLFQRPVGQWLPKKAKVVICGVEFRLGNGVGAASVLPPSDRRTWLPGRQLINGPPVAPLPPALEAVLQEHCGKACSSSAEPTAQVPEGSRNDFLFKEACALAKRKYNVAMIETLLLALNANVCSPPLPEQEVRDIACSAASGKKATDNFLKRLLGELELWHDPNGVPYSTVLQGEHRENWKIGKRVRQWRRYLAKLFYDATGEMLSDKELAEIATTLEGRAYFDGPEFPVWRRVAELDGKIYVDLCDAEWRVVEIDEVGWRILSESPVKFYRAPAMLALPEPIKPPPGATLRALLMPFLNINPPDWALIGGWLIAGLRPRGPYPLLILLGEHGTGKTLKARVLRALLDPSSAPVRAAPRCTHDLAIAANNAHVLCFDNLSNMPPDLSDALCRVSTGGAFVTRTLFSDEDESIFEATRPVILTSIEEVAPRADLVDRSLTIESPTIDEAQRRPEKLFLAEFEKQRPYILGALLDIVVDAMRRLPEIEARGDAELSRMADFHQWATAAEVGLGLEPGEFAERYRANREDAQLVTLESSPFIAMFLRFAAMPENKEVKYTASKLLDKVSHVDYSQSQKQAAGWPKTARVVSAILRRSAPSLRQVGVKVELAKAGNDKLWHIDASKYQSTQSSQSSQKSAIGSPPAHINGTNHLEKCNGANRLGQYLRANMKEVQ